jgi:DNA repair exonuclease SbcCD nuclease subunit
MAENPQNTPSRPSRDNPVRRHFISECRDNRIIVKTHFSANVTRLYRRNFDRFSRAAYLLRFYCRIGADANVESSLTKEIIDLMEEINDNLRKKITVAEQLLKKDNINVSKPQFGPTNVTIIDPLANRFLQTLKTVQELDEKLSALWLACVIDDLQRNKALTEIDGEIRRIQTKTRALSLGVRDRVQARNQARQQDNQSEVAASETDDSRTVAQDINHQAPQEETATLDAEQEVAA